MATKTKRKRVKASDEPAAYRAQLEERARIRRQIRITKDIGRDSRRLVAALKRQHADVFYLHEHLKTWLGIEQPALRRDVTVNG